MSGFDATGIGGPLAARLDAFGRGPAEVVRGGEERPDAKAVSGAFADAIARIDGLSKQVGSEVQQLASGEPVALHEIMMSMGKSEVAFNLMLEVRNKLVDAWEKLSRSVV